MNSPQSLFSRLKGALPWIIVWFVAAFGGSGIAVVITNDNDHTKDRTVVSIPTPAPKGPLGDLQAASPTAPESNLKSEAGKTQDPAGIRATKREGTKLQGHAVGGAQSYHCAELFGSHLYSSRNGVRPTEFVVHYTAGNGTARSIDAFFRRTRAASATYILEPNGRCVQEVPESQKPWTQLAANPYAISVEIVTTGWNVSRSQWLAMPIFRKGTLADLMRDSMTRHGIPLRRVNPAGCNFIPGWTDHNALECGNNHTDVTPHFPYDVLQRQLRSGHVAAASPLSRYERKVIRGAAKPKGSGHSRSYWCGVNRVLRRRITVAHRHGGWKKRHRGVRYQALGKSYRKRCHG